MNKYLVVLDGNRYAVEADLRNSGDVLRFYREGEKEPVAAFRRWDACIRLDEAKPEPKPQEGQTDDGQ